MNEFTFTKDAFSQYVSWQTEDRKIIRKINEILADIQRNGPVNGIGKPEKLKYREGYSRRIDDANRLVYDLDSSGNIRVISCRGHYEY